MLGRNDRIQAINKAIVKVKKMEAAKIPEIHRDKSEWLAAINDVIEQTASAIINELDYIA